MTRHQKMNLYRHRKRGTTYQFVGRAKMQISLETLALLARKNNGTKVDVITGVSICAALEADTFEEMP